MVARGAVLAFMPVDAMPGKIPYGCAANAGEEILFSVLGRQTKRPRSPFIDAVMPGIYRKVRQMMLKRRLPTLLIFQEFAHGYNLSD
ncbi:MAG: hypothetical protein NT169_07745 [Chloroflexi bacterium]|nr:hypothetical protein [Chloroflexota bacterium]